MLEAVSLRKRYGAVTALDGFDLTIEAGEIVGLIGHNGAGKTTFAEIVTGLVRADDGQVRVDGIDARRSARAARAHIGHAPRNSGSIRQRRCDRTSRCSDVCTGCGVAPSPERSKRPPTTSP
jgi:ABC-type multidrug transport system ATPase subunit